MNEHTVYLGLDGKDFHPHCTCGWTGTTTTDLTSFAEAACNVHLAAVGAPLLNLASETWARRYLSANWQGSAA